MITAKEIREKTGLTQAAFADKYSIPLTTYKSWECNPTSSSYRKCPDYVLSLLERAVDNDMKVKSKRKSSKCATS